MISLSKKRTPDALAFKTLTYSHLEVQTAPRGKSHNLQDIKELSLPRFTNSTRKTRAKRKSSSPANFKNATYPLSASTITAPTDAENHEFPATTKLTGQSHQQTDEERNEILAEAREKAAEIIAAAETEADKIKKNVEKKAREEGLKAASEELDDRKSRFDELLKRLSSTQEYCHQKHKKEMVQLALSCTRRLLNREIALDESIIADCVREVLNESSVQGNITLLLNREDMQIINEQHSQLLTEFPLIDLLKNLDIHAF